MSHIHEQDIELLKRKEYIFWRNITIISDFPEDCWLWHGSTNHGYGAILLGTNLGGKQVRIFTHRFSYIMHIGPIPEDKFCLHICDEPRCCNPTHLFLGTQEDNIKDRNNKGRGNTGMKYKKAEK